jgi:hypothetical protein
MYLATKVGGQKTAPITVGDNYWQEKAACRGLSPEYWELPSHATEAGMAKLRSGQMVCRMYCPVRAACLKHASETDLRWTTRGGYLPGTYIPDQPKGEPEIPATTSSLYFPQGECQNGHDTSATGRYSRNGACAECRREQKIRKRERIKQGVAIEPAVPPLTDAEMAAGKCVQGHDIRASEDRSETNRCRSCQQERKNKLSRDRRARLKGRDLSVDADRMAA